VSRYEAVAYSRWLSAQLDADITLPTEQEWEKAARSAQGLEFPWGEFKSAFANINETWGKVGPHNLAQTSAVGSYPQGKSPYGILDMAGNVWEWCLNEYKKPQRTGTKGKADRVMRGGAWDGNRDLARCAYRVGLPPGSRSNVLGFRLVLRSPLFLRRRLVAAALEGSPRAQTILGGIDFEGNARGAAVEVVKALGDFGQVVYGKEALGVFLGYVQSLCGDEQAAFIAELFSAYPFHAAGARRDRPISRWRGSESPEAIREKIIGENTLKDIRFLELALQAAKAVVRIGLPNDEAGSGFMVPPNLLMTANHVIGSEEEAHGAEFWFNYELDSAGKPRETVLVKAGALLHNHRELDYSLVELADPPDFGPPLRLRPPVPNNDQRVSIIQHPGGHLKKISMQNNFVAYSDRQVIQYTTATTKGSSGSPVFNDAFEVIAIHTKRRHQHVCRAGRPESQRAGNLCPNHGLVRVGRCFIPAHQSQLSRNGGQRSLS